MNLQVVHEEKEVFASEALRELLQELNELLSLDRLRMDDEVFDTNVFTDSSKQSLSLDLDLALSHIDS